MAKKGKLFGMFHPAVIAVYAAIIAASALIPSIPLVGTGGTFSVSTALVPLAGVFFGPFAGALCAAIGGFIGQLIAPSTAWMGIATFLIGVISAFTAGALCYKKWFFSLGVGIIGMVLWFCTAIGRGAPFFAIVFYGLGIVAAIIGIFVANKWMISNNVAKKSAAVFLCAFVGMVTSASIANFFGGILMYQLPSEVWNVLIFVSPLERSIFSLAATVIGVPLLVGLPKVGIFIGPQSEEEEAPLAEPVQ